MLGDLDLKGFRFDEDVAELPLGEVPIDHRGRMVLRHLQWIVHRQRRVEKSLGSQLFYLDGPSHKCV